MVHLVPEVLAIMTGQTVSPEERVRELPSWTWVALLVLAVAFHISVATLRWNSPALVDHEFRQAQTAVIAHYIDEQNNFSIDYDTPVFGKPWQVPLEFPLYQWTVVGVSRLLDQPHVPVARGVSLASFYGTLTALWVLLGTLGVHWTRRCWLLVFVLASPVYLYYSRAFLIDPMAAMASAWFLAAYGRSLTTRWWPWGVLAALAAAAGALIKSVVFFVWLVPAAIWGAVNLWRALREKKGWRSVGAALAWGLLPVLPTLFLLKWWISHTDAIKAAHPSGYIFTSDHLSVQNFGSFSVVSRFDVETWSALFMRWGEAMIGPIWVGVVLVLGGMCARRYRGLAWAGLGLFLVGQVAFPYAYAYQDYYFYAAGFYLALGLGFVGLGWIESPRVPRWLGVALAVFPLGLLAHNYHRFYYQNLVSAGDRDWSATRILRETLPEDAVIVVGGDDWSAVVTYQTERRSLMVRNGLDYDGAYLARAFEDLDGEKVGALMLFNQALENENFRRYAVRHFNLDPGPTFRYGSWEVHVARDLREAVVQEIVTHPDIYYDVEVLAAVEAPAEPEPEIVRLSEEASREAFPVLAGDMYAYRSPHGVFHAEIGKRQWTGVHPPAELWIQPSSRRGVLRLVVGIDAGAYEGKKPWDGTDGVGYSVYRESADGLRTRLAWRYFDPIKVANDRGDIELMVEYALNDGESLVVTTSTGMNGAYDWSYISGYDVTP